MYNVYIAIILLSAHSSERTSSYDCSYFMVDFIKFRGASGNIIAED